MNESGQNTISGERRYYDIPAYNGKQNFDGWVTQYKRMPVLIGGFLSSCAFAGFFVLLNRRFSLVHLFIIVFITFLFYAIRLKEETHLGKVDISDAGITKTYGESSMCLKWEEIDYIRVIPKYNGTRAKVIYIKNIISRDDENARRTCKIVIPYSHKAAHCITNQWSKEIQNLADMKSWQRYTVRL